MVGCWPSSVLRPLSSQSHSPADLRAPFSSTSRSPCSSPQHSTEPCSARSQRFAAIIGLVAVDTTSDADSLPTTLPLMVVFYALIGITFSQARRIFIEEPEERTATTQYRRLESAHLLLADLASLAGSAELNPVTIGRAALRDLAVIVPYAAGSVAINDGSEQIIVATRGQPGRGDEAVIFPSTWTATISEHCASGRFQRQPRSPPGLYR